MWAAVVFQFELFRPQVWLRRAAAVSINIFIQFVYDVCSGSISISRYGTQESIIVDSITKTNLYKAMSAQKRGFTLSLYFTLALPLAVSFTRSKKTFFV